MSFEDEKFPEPDERPARRIVITCPAHPEFEPVVIDVPAMPIPPGWREKEAE
ncbi:MAG: hypothetical protein QM756_26550 [Polyangiaceae bacterium]